MVIHSGGYRWPCKSQRRSLWPLVAASCLIARGGVCKTLMHPYLPITDDRIVVQQERYEDAQAV